MRAMERAGVIRTLAEPTLTAISESPRVFWSGANSPVPGGSSCQQNICTTTVQFKKFGVGLNFTPIVRRMGASSLKVMSEVSELSTENSLPLLGGAASLPYASGAPTQRFEIPSGGSIGLAGLIQEQTKQQINGIPALMQVPILGNAVQKPRLTSIIKPSCHNRYPLRRPGNGAKQPVSSR